MTQSKTIIALKESIGKWEGIVAGVKSDEGAENCSLCFRFNNGSNQPRCTLNGEKCPVYKVTGKPLCEGSPYEDWIESYRFSPYEDQFDEGIIACDDETVMCAQLELEFLRDLLEDMTFIQRENKMNFSKERADALDWWRAMTKETQLKVWKDNYKGSFSFEAFSASSREIHKIFVSMIEASAKNFKHL